MSKLYKYSAMVIVGFGFLGSASAMDEIEELQKSIKKVEKERKSISEKTDKYREQKDKIINYIKNLEYLDIFNLLSEVPDEIFEDQSYISTIINTMKQNKKSSNEDEYGVITAGLTAIKNRRLTVMFLALFLYFAEDLDRIEKFNENVLKASKGMFIKFKNAGLQYLGSQQRLEDVINKIEQVILSK